MKKEWGARQHTLEDMCRDLGIPVTRYEGSTGHCFQATISRSQASILESAIKERIAWIQAKKAEREVRKVECRESKAEQCIRMLESYVARLRASGQALPRRNGALSFLQVARWSGFSNDIWYRYPAVKARAQQIDAEDRFALGLGAQEPLALLRRYLRELAERGQQVPIRKKGAWAPCYYRIAKAAGFTTSVFCKHPEAVALVERYVTTYQKARTSPAFDAEYKGSLWERRVG